MDDEFELLCMYADDNDPTLFKHENLRTENVRLQKELDCLKQDYQHYIEIQIDKVKEIELAMETKLKLAQKETDRLQAREKILMAKLKSTLSKNWKLEQLQSESVIAQPAAQPAAQNSPAPRRPTLQPPTPPLLNLMVPGTKHFLETLMPRITTPALDTTITKFLQTFLD